MTPVSSINARAMQALAEPEKSLSAQKVQESQEETQSRPIRAGKDEYIPEEKSEPFGRYWIGKDEDGQPKVFFDDPEKAVGAPGKSKDTPDTEKADPDKKRTIPRRPAKKANAAFAAPIRLIVKSKN